MYRKWMFRSALPALLLTLAIGSCDAPTTTAPEPSSTTATEQQAPDSQSGLIGDLLTTTTDLLGSVVGLVVQGTDGEEYTLIGDVLSQDTDDVLRITDEIGPDGGTLRLAAHTLTVPPGAVEERTLFTMEVVTNGVIEVELTAMQESGGWLLSSWEEVGTEDDPFLKPVTLTLTYVRATNLQELLEEGDRDETDLINMRRLGDDYDSYYEPLESTVDVQNQRVTSQLRHFSPYCMAM